MPSLLEKKTKWMIHRGARASFTRKGKGVTSRLRDVLKAMSPEERIIAKSKGWDKGLLVQTSNQELVVR